MSGMTWSRRQAPRGPLTGSVRYDVGAQRQAPGSPPTVIVGYDVGRRGRLLGVLWPRIPWVSWGRLVRSTGSPRPVHVWSGVGSSAKRYSGGLRNHPGESCVAFPPICCQWTKGPRTSNRASARISAGRFRRFPERLSVLTQGVERFSGDSGGPGRPPNNALWMSSGLGHHPGKICVAFPPICGQ